MTGAHQMEPPCPLISWVNPFPRRFINRTTFFCNAWIAWMCLLPAVWSKAILLSFLYFHWLFPLLACETSSGNCSIYKSTRERVDSNGLYGKWRLHLMGSCQWVQDMPLTWANYKLAQIPRLKQKQYKYIRCHGAFRPNHDQRQLSQKLLLPLVLKQACSTALHDEMCDKQATSYTNHQHNNGDPCC